MVKVEKECVYKKINKIENNQKEQDTVKGSVDYNVHDIGCGVDSKNDNVSFNNLHSYVDNHHYKTRIFWNSKYKKNYSNTSDNLDFKPNCYKYGQGISNTRLIDKDSLNEMKVEIKFKFKQCSDKRCKTCKMANVNQIDETSSFTFCKTFNCIYKMKCNVCNYNYIGQTSNSLNLRMNQHRSDTKNFNNNFLLKNKIEISHFKQHGFENIVLDILRVVPKVKNRLWWENYFIGSFNTVYPYGLNVIYFNKNVLNTVTSENTKYFYRIEVNKEVKRFGKSTRSKGKRVVRRDKDILNELQELGKNFNSDYDVKCIKRFMFGLNKKEIIGVRVKLFEHLPSTHGHDLIRDIFKFLCRKQNIVQKINDNRVSEYCTINYMNKTFDKINFHEIFKSLEECFPVNVKIKKAFKYNKQLGRSIFNYNDFKDNMVDNVCNCSNYSGFVDPDHGHVITGDLKIVENEKLREVMRKGTKHRLIKSNNNKKIKTNLKLDIENFILKIAIKYGMPIEAFNEFKYKILKHLYSLNYKAQEELTFFDIKQQIVDLQNKFVIVYVDKVPGNFAIICKKFYCNLLQEHLHNNEAYVISKFSNCEINNRILAIHKKMNISCYKVVYPHIFLTPKFHKNPIKFRSVTNGSRTYITKAGKILQKIMQNVIDKLKCNSNTAIINNSFEIVEMVKDVKLFSVFSYDFQDLFNSIDIDDMIKVLLEIYKLFDMKEVLELNKFKTLINFVLKENYIIFNDKLQHQIKGLPQGGPASNCLANLYLHFYEYKNLNKNLCILCRYIDDLVLFAKVEEFRPKLDFYPNYLILLKTNNNDYYSEFLDLKISIIGYKVCTDIYDKRNDFKFNINKLPFWDSNLSISVFRNILLNYCYRNSKLVNDKDTRSFNIANFMQTALQYDYPRQFLISYIYR